MIALLRLTLVITLCFSSIQVIAFDFKQGHFLLEAGGYNSHQGKAQFIGINGLIGDQFNLNEKSNNNAIFGLGYIVPGIEANAFDINYGINVFYLSNSKISGTIDQELLFRNLAYSYEVSNLPIYLTTKALIKTNSEALNITLDAGIGPNLIKTHKFNNWSIDGGITLPDYSFYGTTSVSFSATAGIGVRMNHVIGPLPLECGYRFFYLGESELDRRTNQLLNQLKTGNNYAQAIMCTLTV